MESRLLSLSNLKAELKSELQLAVDHHLAGAFVATGADAHMRMRAISHCLS
jgi:hypothetical protein